MSGASGAATSLPPGPRAGVLRQTVAFHRDPLRFLRSAQGEHGDVFTLRLLTARPLAVVSEPAAVAALLGGDPQYAHAGEGRLRILPFASARSVFGGDAERHRTARERIGPAMSAAAIDAHRPEMERIAARHAARFPLERPFQLLPRLRAVTDEIFVRLVLGVRDETIAAALIAAIQRMLRTPGNPPSTIPGRGDGLAGELGEAIFMRRSAPVSRHLRSAVGARRAEPPGEADVLGCMVAARPPLEGHEIVDELLSLLMAAQEPPAIALAWLLDRLGREPQLRERFLAEPEGAVAEGVVRETLRLQPPASAAIRRLHEPLRAGRYELPAGITALLPTALLQRDPRAFNDPDQFRPERWHSDETPTGTYFPFGGGARRCVGEPLARAEIATVVPSILSTVQLAPVAAQPERMVQRATVLVPQHGLLAVAQRR